MPNGGIDFGAPAGTPIRAAAGGVVALADQLQIRGGATILDHGWGVFTAYWHQASVLVKPGQAVQAGEVIGTVGNTGLSTGTHLHWEVWANGNQVDPTQWLAQVQSVQCCSRPSGASILAPHSRSKSTWAHVPSTAHINHCILRKRSSDPEVWLATQRQPHSPYGYTSVKFSTGLRHMLCSPISGGTSASMRAVRHAVSVRIIWQPTAE